MINPKWMVITRVVPRVSIDPAVAKTQHQLALQRVRKGGTDLANLILIASFVLAGLFLQFWVNRDHCV